jgi:hypothetical protein
MAWRNRIAEFPARLAPEKNTGLNDLRFRTLLGKDEWEHLPPETRRRFSKRLAGGKTVVYVGEIDDVNFSPAGRCLVQLARFIGGPLPIAEDVRVPMIVTVTRTSPPAARYGHAFARAGTDFRRSFTHRSVSQVPRD